MLNRINKKIALVPIWICAIILFYPFAIKLFSRFPEKRVFTGFCLFISSFLLLVTDKKKSGNILNITKMDIAVLCFAIVTLVASLKQTIR